MGDHPEVTFFVNDEVLVVHTRSLSVREIFDISGLRADDHELYEHRNGREEVFVDLDQRIDLHGDLRLHTRRVYRIVVNGRHRVVHHDIVSYEQIVELAPNLPPLQPEGVYLVTFKDAAEKPTGDLVAGETLHIKNGTEFVVVPGNRS